MFLLVAEKNVLHADVIYHLIFLRPDVVPTLRNIAETISKRVQMLKSSSLVIYTNHVSGSDYVKRSWFTHIHPLVGEKYLHVDEYNLKPI